MAKPKRKKFSATCSVDLGAPDGQVALPPSPVRLVCWGCEMGFWESAEVWRVAKGIKARCHMCGGKLREVVEMSRLSLGAVKAALLKG